MIKIVDEFRDTPGMKKKYAVHCPYCWAESTLKVKGNYDIVTSHPMIVPTSDEFPQAIFPCWMFWVAKYPIGVREGSTECQSCGRIFYVGLFPYGYDDFRYSTDIKYYLNILREKKTSERKFLLEDILDRFSNYFRIGYPLNCFFFILALFTLFCIIPAIPLRGLSKISHDYGLPFLLFFSGLMLVFLKHHSMMLVNTLNFQKMPIFLSNQYKDSNLCTQLEENLRGWIFGHPFQMIKPPTFCGLVAVAFFLIWHINYVFNMCSTFHETPFTEFPITYTSYMSAIISTPFWAMIYFIIGNITWFFFVTTALVGLITRNLPIEINLLKEMGGTEIFGKIVLSSAYTAAAIGAALTINVIWSSGQETYVLLISILLCSIFISLMIFGFFYPLLPIHKELKQKKEVEIDKILKKISLPAIEGEMNLRDALHTYLLWDLFGKISRMNEWPFRTAIIIRLSSTILLPLTSSIINIILFTP